MSTFIESIDNVLPSDLCRRLIEAFDARLSQQEIGRIGGGIDVSKKRSSDITLSGRQDWHALRAEVEEAVFPRLCEYAQRYHFLLIGALSPVVAHPVTGAPVTLDAEAYPHFGAAFVPALVKRCFRLGVLNLQKYDKDVGGYPHWHSEVYPQSGSEDALHRVLFWICYLNDVALGGETEFVYQQVKIEPRTGRLLVAPAGFTHTHRGNIPTSGPKYVLASWLLYQQAEVLFGKSTVSGSPQK